ncbi:NUDIX domain-containing protein [Rhizosaccharibacter radicis]|uniref:GDP-mannose pyrophosphatase n=1 Tax=Rhizosaccharibacter radicis TaxID=2782605 RepID=A0ABT1VYS4_9PROT|nr:NUDIX hydrolase [Acetobacteraceae bacterium KSS12]
MSNGIVTLSSRIAYQNRWLRLREDIIRRPDGSEGLYGVVERGEFVVIVARDADGSVAMVEQFRYPIGRRLWELPMGMWEHRPDAGMDQVAAGELEEECGLLAERLEHAGIVFQGAGYSNQKGHVFLASGLRRTATRREQTEQDMEFRMMPLAELERMIRENEITCMVTLAAIGMLRMKGML